MEFINADIRAEYERNVALCADVEELRAPYVNISDTLRAYYALADYFTDPDSGKAETMLVNLRSADLLYSAIMRQAVSFGGRKKYVKPLDVCSTLFYGMVKNHAFSDGNKRTALLTLLYQLDLYGFMPCCRVEEFERLVLAVAANELPKTYRAVWSREQGSGDPEVRTIARVLSGMTKRKDHTYHLKITMRDLVAALESHGVQCERKGGKIRFTRVTREGNFFGRGREELNFAVVFGGWTRVLGATTVRTILERMKLYDQFPDYGSFVGGTALYYSLIGDFERPLRRLKDE